ncbi:DUF4395 domain-containing protein [Arthrobacter sp. LAPM80]|uniref:DUF4395 domain-containing protein n=1 Tax=Arthrobacter sp. LAPM80 TaxID=3141788 RepID=UPI00398AA003
MTQRAGITDATDLIRLPLTDAGLTGAAPTGAARPGRLGRFFAFPNPVNDHAARITAGIVVVLTLAALVATQVWLVGVIAAGFVLRLAFGPRVSPAALLSVKVLAPLMGEPKLVPGPPKRFAQGIGAVLSTTAFGLLLSGAALAGWTLMVLLVLAAALEAFLGLCLGCIIFGFLARRGLIPAGICEECANVGLRKGQAIPLS